MISKLNRGYTLYRPGAGLVATNWAAAESEANVVKLTEKDDIEAHLTTFERIMGAYNIAKERWVFKLAPQLSGKAQQAYAALQTDEAKDCKRVKANILRRYNIYVTGLASEADMVVMEQAMSGYCNCIFIKSLEFRIVFFSIKKFFWFRIVLVPCL